MSDVGGVIVPKKTVICYLSSLLFYGMGYSKMLILKTGYVNTHVTLGMVYFVLTIFLAVIGSFFLYVKYIQNQGIEINDMEFRVKAGRGLDGRRRASIPEVKAQLSQSKYSMDLERRMSS